MFLSKYKTKSLVGTDKEFIPITNLKYKSTIQTIRCSIEEATKAYEVDQTKVDSLKEMREYLKQNAKKPIKPTASQPSSHHGNQSCSKPT